MIVKALFPTHPVRPMYSRRYGDAGYTDMETISIEKIKSAVRVLRNNTAPGPNGIPNEAIKRNARGDPALLRDIYNLVEGCFPCIWKRARLVLLRKGDKLLDSVSSYRPLCLLDCAGKLLEKILDNRIRHFLESTKALADSQYGFRKERSTTDAIIKLRKAVENNRPSIRIGVLALDVKNAFNSVPWVRIIDAMREKALPVYLQQMIESYLSQRDIMFEESGVVSVLELTSGVPQGSVLEGQLYQVG